MAYFLVLLPGLLPEPLLPELPGLAELPPVLLLDPPTLPGLALPLLIDVPALPVPLEPLEPPRLLDPL